MKTTMYLNYPARSLLRGGQRTALALFCVAVGVMAIVGLQLVGGMISRALVGNARVINGGDLSVRVVTPLAQNDLAIFDELKRDGLITTYTAVYNQAIQLPKQGGGRANVEMQVVDPQLFPLTGQPPLERSAGGDWRALLSAPGSAVISRGLFDSLGGELGKTVRITAGLDSRQIDVTIKGVLDRESTLGSNDATLFISQATFNAGATNASMGYSAVYAVSPDDARAKEGADRLKDRFAGASVQTAAGLLQQLKDSVEQINRFLVIVGLLALLIGGVGIVNTMQVLLARRRVEIAMLKTAGYQRRDLYLLFGLEAAILGLVGGIVGALAGIGVAAIVRTLFERAFLLVLSFTVDPTIVVGGVLVGLVTALIFGLLPIVQAAGVRPTAVLRELPEGRTWRTTLGSVALVLLLSVLFAVLSTVIIGSLQWGLAAVYGAFAALAILSLFFGLLIWVIGRLPVPERYSWPFLLLVTLAVIAAAAITVVRDLRGIGILLLLATLAGYVIVLLPREWKISAKMAFRNIGRARGRTTTTMLALFVGVFAVGLVLVLGQGIRETIDSFLASQLRYNVLALVRSDQSAAFAAALDTQGDSVKARQSVQVALLAQPLDINGQPLASIVAGYDPKHQGPPASVYVSNLSGLQGYDLAHGQLPQVGVAPEALQDEYGLGGRSLTAADAGTDNVIVDALLRAKPTSMKVGDKITMLNQFTGDRRTLTVVGFYKASDTGISINLNLAPVFGSLEATRALGGAATQNVWYLQVENGKAGAVTDALTTAVPQAQVLNFADFLSQFGQVLNNLLLMLTAIASLALFAGIVIIANAVALAMLERRRELGIMKAMGYTSRRVLGVILIENGLIGAIGGLLGMLLVAVGTFAFNRALGLSIGVNMQTTIGLIVLVAAVAMLVAAFVGWSATRVRPLEVLRYE